ncbi:Type II/IV secretion system secretin RcpA/CpaC, associated with Flp pilus assembly [Fimbriiglobus ruber]|uniref:Type II/IV secretion system secretin RcpA/CpaC, associated with Flp pilus assembly n=1 Tax=Fimbriiglobus ruber TaxID=1908690 RepID=A0A225D0X6_9BACT|nr:Type II/IV secretion system secretin RcpA/CpaC, associated with Flp pilus assembly [Fimbriiglobus ruber]
MGWGFKGLLLLLVVGLTAARGGTNSDRLLQATSPLASPPPGRLAPVPRQERGSTTPPADPPAYLPPTPAAPGPRPDGGNPTVPADPPAGLPIPVAPGPRPDGGTTTPPADPPAGFLLAPRQIPTGRDRIRLPRMGTELGGTPIPTPGDLEEQNLFVDRIVDPRLTLDLIEGRSRLIMLKAIPTQTQIADDTVASFRLLQPNGTQLTIIGRKPGLTVLNLWFADPKNKGKERILSYMVRVLPDPEAKERAESVYKALEIEINRAFPNSRVRLSLVGDKLMVSGQAHDIQEATQILQIARANAPGGGGTGTGTAGDGTRPPGGPAGRVPLSSLTPTTNPLDPLRPDPTPGLEDYQTAGGPMVINHLRVPGEQQVMIQVVVAEVNRAAARSIGLDFSIFNKAGTMVFGQLTGGLTSAASATAANTQNAGTGGIANLPANLSNGQVSLAINALRTLNYARSLAQPNLTAMNGQTATFLAGGQFPVPVIGGFGATANGAGLQGVQFVPYGVQLSFTPIVTDRDRIRLSLGATVSTRDNSGAATVGGTNVPALNTRTFSTTVEFRPGQTLAVAGLIQMNLGATANRVPLVGDLPIIGRAASFQQITAGEQELVVLITPVLVHPMDPYEVPPALPGSDITEPGDIEFYLLGRLEGRRTYDYRSTVRTDIHRMLRYRRCEEAYIVGPTGHSEPPAASPPYPGTGKR